MKFWSTSHIGPFLAAGDLLALGFPSVPKLGLRGGSRCGSHGM